MTVERILYCSFCGKSQHEVAKLIAGPSTFICDECVDLCRDIVEEAKPDRAAKPTAREAAALREMRLRCVDLARSYGGRDGELLTRAREIAAFVLGEEVPGDQVEAAIKAAGQRMAG